MAKPSRALIVRAPLKNLDSKIWSPKFGIHKNFIWPKMATTRGLTSKLIYPSIKHHVDGTEKKDGGGGIKWGWRRRFFECLDLHATEESQLKKAVAAVKKEVIIENFNSEEIASSPWPKSHCIVHNAKVLWNEENETPPRRWKIGDRPRRKRWPKRGTERYSADTYLILKGAQIKLRREKCALIIMYWWNYVAVRVAKTCTEQRGDVLRL